MSRNTSLALIGDQIPTHVLDWFDATLQAGSPIALCDVKVHRRARCHYLWIPAQTAPRLHKAMYELCWDAAAEGHDHLYLIPSMDLLAPLKLHFAALPPNWSHANG